LACRVMPIHSNHCPSIEQTTEQTTEIDHIRSITELWSRIANGWAGDPKGNVPAALKATGKGLSTGIKEMFGFGDIGVTVKPSRTGLVIAGQYLAQHGVGLRFADESPISPAAAS
jgi:hypothetical protein